MIMCFGFPVCTFSKHIYTSYQPSARSVRQVMDPVFSIPFLAQARSSRAMKQEGKNKDP